MILRRVRTLIISNNVIQKNRNQIEMCRHVLGKDVNNNNGGGGGGVVVGGWGGSGVPML